MKEWLDSLKPEWRKYAHTEYGVISNTNDSRWYAEYSGNMTVFQLAIESNQPKIARAILAAAGVEQLGSDIARVRYLIHPHKLFFYSVMFVYSQSKMVIWRQ